MKYWTQIMLFLSVSFFGFGQGNVTYKVIKDQPDDAANYWINVGLLDMGFATKNAGYGLIGASLNGVVNIKNKLGGEFTMRSFYFSLGKERGTNFEIGGFYNLFSKQKIKNQKVVLSSKSSSSGGRTSTETISMKVPGTIMRSLGVRAGFNTQKNVVVGTLANHGFEGDYMFRSSGLYAGILITGQMNLKTHTSEYGTKGFGIVRRTYIDVLFNPIRSLSDITTGNDFKPTDSPGAIGYRFGVEFLQPEPRKVQGNAIYQKFEIGSRPMQGYYLLYSVGFNFKRKVKALSSFKAVREME